MSFLIIQIFLLMLLAAVFGAWLAYWWMNNRYEDVTESHETLLGSIQGLKDAPPAVTAEDLDMRFAGLSSAVDGIRLPDLNPLEARMASLEQMVSNIHVPEPDLAPVNERLQFIETHLMSPDQDIENLHGRLDKLDTSFVGMRDKVETLHNTDIGHLESRLADLDRAIRETEIPDVDLGPVHSALATTQFMIESLEFPKTNLDPVQTQVAMVERRLVELTERLESMRQNDMETLGSRLSGLSSRMNDIRSPDMEPILSRLASVEREINALNVPDLDIAPIQERLVSIEKDVSSLATTSSATPDIQPLFERFDSLETRVSGPNHILELLRTRMASLETGLAELSNALASMPDTDLRPLEARLMRIEELSQQVSRNQRSDLDALAARLPDLEPVRTHLMALEREVAAFNVPEPDLKPFHTMMVGLERAISSIDRTPVDLKPLEDRLVELSSQVAANDMRLDELRGDLRPIAAVQDILLRVDALQDDFRRLELPEPDLSSIEARLKSLHESVLDIVLPDLDLSPVLSSVRAIDSRLDLEATESRLTSIEYGLAAIHHQLRQRGGGEGGKTSRTDLEARWSDQPRRSMREAPSERDTGFDRPEPAPVREPREARESREPREISRREPPARRQFREVRETRTPDPAPESRPESRSESRFTSRPVRPSKKDDPINRYVRSGDKANLLSEAAFGEADDLEEIVGVGPMLGALLNEIGVFYFWQIAEWDQDEIDWVDGQLMHFRGRIQREDWVGQSAELAAKPGAARRP